LNRTDFFGILDGMKKPVRCFSSIVGLVGLMALFQACSSPYRVEYLEDSLAHVTQEELIHKFGYPQRLKRTNQGGQVWEYDFQGKGIECASYIITFDQHEQIQQWHRMDCGASGGKSGPVNVLK
jgi:hypothetical protein